MPWANRWGVAVLLALTACGSRTGDGTFNQPIALTLAGGVPVLTARVQSTDQIAQLVVDSASAITTLSPEVTGTNAPSLARETLTIEAQSNEADPIFEFYPRTLLINEILPIGAAGAPFLADGMLGVDLLHSFAVALDYERPSLTFFERIDTSDNQFSQQCQSAIAEGRAVTCVGSMPTPRFGGGLVVAGDDNADFGATRSTVPVCIEQKGTDEATAVLTPLTSWLATGLPVSLISAAAAERLRTRGHTLTDGAEQALQLPNGTVQASSISFSRALLVGDETRQLGACQEYQRRVALAAGEAPPFVPTLEDDNVNGAAVVLLPGEVTLYVIADTNSLLVGVRDELRPFIADIDLIIGSDLLALTTPTFDYPKNRMLFRCSQPSAEQGCAVLPFCEESNPTRCRVNTPSDPS